MRFLLFLLILMSTTAFGATPEDRLSAVFQSIEANKTDDVFIADKIEWSDAAAIASRFASRESPDYGRIKVGVSRVAMFRYPRERDFVVTFDQDYRSDLRGERLKPRKKQGAG